MKCYLNQLGLRFDPFESIAGTTHFYTRAGREDLLDELLQLTRYSRDIVVVTGPLGAGKSSLAEWFIKSLGKDSVVAHVQATLFMNKVQILEAISTELGIHVDAGQAEASLVNSIREWISAFSSTDRHLQLVIDDAHELGEGALGILLELARDPALTSTTHLLLLGETHLLNMLEQLLPFNREIVAFSGLVLPGLNSEEALDYVSFKLRSAGFKGEFPIDPGVMGDIYNLSSGIPGTINALVRDKLEVSNFKPVNSKLEIPSIYYATAAVLLLALFVTVFFTDSNTGQNYSMQISATQQVQINLPVQPILSAVTEDKPITEAISQVPVSTAITEPVKIPEATEEIVPVLPQPAYSEFESQLLARAPQSYTLQVLGSQSEVKVHEFIAEQSGSSSFAYFESRYQNQPWFVAVYGDFKDREAASAAIATLPEALKTLRPWARALSGIQADIRKYNQ
ncbi:MAG: AAA family ATPase [Pseudohongiellaceae bacterium]